MKQKIDLQLSSELEQFRNSIEKTVKPYIEIRPTNNHKPTLWQSKFGGFPYLPKNFEYPKNDNGDYLYLLAQFHLAEVPKLEGLPEKGILQFYISDDWLNDCDNNHIYDGKYDEPIIKNEYKVVYFSEIKFSNQELITDFSFLPSTEKSSLLKEASCIEFTINYLPISIDDYQFNIFKLEDYKDRDKEEIYWQIFREYNDKFNARGHKLLGYPFCFNEDIRAYLPDRDYILLFQMDSFIRKKGFSIRWKEMGICNFFIRQSNLKNLDFTRVICDWDY